MKKSLLMAALAAVVSVGCSGVSQEQSAFNKEYVIDVSKYPNANEDFSLDQEFEYQAVEQYGSPAFKVISSCYSKYGPMMSNIDTSTDYGSTVLGEYLVKVETCTFATLRELHVAIPLDQRQKIQRENIGLELNEDEVENFNQTPVAPYDKTSPRYKELLATCSANNNSIEDDQEFVSAVDFCISKGM